MQLSDTQHRIYVCGGQIEVIIVLIIQMRANDHIFHQFPIWPRTALTQLDLVTSLMCFVAHSHLQGLGFAPTAIRIRVMLNDSKYPMELICLMLSHHRILMKLEHRAGQTAKESQAAVFPLQI